MIKASFTRPDGRQMLIIGLSFRNLDEFRALPGDTYIEINDAELGLATDVVIFSGETEAACANVIKGLISPETKVSVSNKLKN